MAPKVEHPERVTLFQALHAVDDGGDAARPLESFIAARLHDAGVWSSPRRSDGIASIRVIERGPNLLRVCGEIWEIDQTRHSFCLEARCDHGTEDRATWMLFFDIDTTGMSPRRARHTLDLLREPGEIPWHITITGREE